LVVNLRDPIGIIVAQNEETLISIFIDWESGANLNSAAFTFLGTPSASPRIEWFSLPDNADAMPPTNILHQIIEENTVIPATGTLTYQWPRGNVYLQMLHAFSMQ